MRKTPIAPEKINSARKRRLHFISARLLVVSIALALIAVAVFTVGALASVEKGSAALSSGASSQTDTLAASQGTKSVLIQQGKKGIKAESVISAASTRFVDTAGTCSGNSPCYTTIQAAINASTAGDTINVLAGTYDEDVAISLNNLSLLGFGAGVKTIRGVIGGSSSTVQVSANNVTIAGFAITRLGNNTTDWNNPGLNLAGISVQGQAVTGMLVRDNIITGNRSAIDVNNSNGHTIRNNVIDFNRTGLIFGNQTDNETVVENFITNNWTVGVLFLDRSGSGTPPQQALHSTFSNNNISAN